MGPVDGGAVAVAVPLWRTDPARWARGFEDARTLALDVGALVAGIEEVCAAVVSELSVSAAVPSSATADAALRALGAVGYRHNGGYSRNVLPVIRHGGYTFPASPAGVAALRALRSYSASLAVDTGALGGEVARILGAGGRSLALVGANGSAFGGFGALRAHRGQVSCAVALDVLGLPSAGTAGAPVVRGALVGRVVSGEEIEEWRDSEGVCVDGAARFLRSVDCEHDVPEGSYSCDSCGAECESDEPEGLRNVDDLELTPEVIRKLSTAGYLESVADFLDASADEGTAWESFAARDAASVVGENPVTVDAPRYDLARWRFVADYAAIDGAGEQDAATLLSAVPMLASVVAAHETAGALPAVPGKLVRREGEGAWTWAQVGSTWALRQDGAEGFSVELRFDGVDKEKRARRFLVAADGEASHAMELQPDGSLVASATAQLVGDRVREALMFDAGVTSV